jgi:hypothetical protein
MFCLVLHILKRISTAKMALASGNLANSVVTAVCGASGPGLTSPLAARTSRNGFAEAIVSSTLASFVHAPR